MSNARRAALLFLLVLGAAATTWTVVDRTTWDGAVSATPGAAPTATARGPAAAESAAPPRRERVHVRPDAATDAAPTDATPADHTVASPEDRSGDGAPQHLDPAELQRLLDELRRHVDSGGAPDDALHAVPARDPVRAEPPVVAPGAPPELAFATFVARGADSVDGAAELVGERRPKLEEGVPVALTGRVISQEDESPVVGATVVVTSTFYVRTTFYDHHLREVARAVTDHEGRWSIERLNAEPAHFGRGGKAFVTVTANGFAPALGLPVADLSPGIRNRLGDVRLDAAVHSLTGRVLDIWEGRPVVGARVIATGTVDPVVYPKDQRDALFLGAPTTTTDADGRFVLTGLGPGTQVISVHGGDDCVGRETYRLPHDAEVTIRTRGIGGRIEGEVVDARGDPIPLVMVDGGGNSTHSFADGHFVLENIRGDKITITLLHPEFRPVEVPNVPDGASGLVVHLERLRPTLTLDVRDADNEAPIAHVVVTYAFPEGVAPRGLTSPHHIASDGRHVVRLPDDATSLTVAADTYEPATLDLTNRTDGDTVVVALAVRTTAPQSEK